jgi:acyl carrier protein
VKATIEAIVEWIGRAAADRFPNEQIQSDTPIIENGILDSIEILNLVSFLEERFGIAVPVEAFVPENFASAEAITSLVMRLRTLQPVR